MSSFADFFPIAAERLFFNLTTYHTLKFAKDLPEHSYKEGFSIFQRSIPYRAWEPQRQFDSEGLPKLHYHIDAFVS